MLYMLLSEHGMGKSWWVGKCSLAIIKQTPMWSGLSHGVAITCYFCTYDWASVFQHIRTSIDDVVRLQLLSSFFIFHLIHYYTVPFLFSRSFHSIPFWWHARISSQGTRKGWLHVFSFASFSPNLNKNSNKHDVMMTMTTQSLILIPVTFPFSLEHWLLFLVDKKEKLLVPLVDAKVICTWVVDTFLQKDCVL